MLDPTIFNDNRLSDPDNKFSSIESSDLTKKGSYSILYKVYHTKYALNFIESPIPFTITIVSPCENPTSLS